MYCFQERNKKLKINGETENPSNGRPMVWEETWHGVKMNSFVVQRVLWCGSLSVHCIFIRRTCANIFFLGYIYKYFFLFLKSFFIYLHVHTEIISRFQTKIWCNPMVDENMICTFGQWMNCLQLHKSTERGEISF